MGIASSKMIEELIKLRKEIHQHPELSGQEIRTSKRIINFVEPHNPTKIIDKIGGHGLAVVYEFGKEGPTVMIRCELDALPIEESNTFNHTSIHKGVSHKCGHDGHMAIVAGLAFWIKEQRFRSGTVILFFQPAEETGKGALNVIEDPKFKRLKPDFIFALHNLPGEPMHTVLAKQGCFSALVQSTIITLTGKESHASEPKNGLNPTLALSEIIDALSTLNHYNAADEDFSILTPVYITLGAPSYGISPGKAEIHYTLRAWNPAKMKALEQRIYDITRKSCKNHGLQLKVEWLEYFPETTNDAECYTRIKNAATANNLELKEAHSPLRFGEDFGWFSRHFKTAIFGLGAGVHTPSLHHADYDFPDELIETGITMFKSIIAGILKD
ncbi:MAG: amidohydrolase [Bacteroidota bacterium]